MIRHIYACACGTETECQEEDLRLGRVFQCPRCKEVCAHVYPQGGGRAWIRVSPQDVRFHHLIGDAQ
jgi:hypothetical protein